MSGIGSVLLFFFVFWFFEVKPKKPKWQNLCPSVWHGVSTFVFFFGFFWFFEVKPKKQKKKTKWQNLCPSVWHGVSTFVFFVFLVFRGKTKKTKWQNLCPSVWHGVSTFVFFCFFRFFEVKPKKKNKMAEPMSQCLAWGQYFFFIIFSRFLQYSGI